MAGWLRCGWQKSGRDRHGGLGGANHSNHRRQGRDSDRVPEDSCMGAHEAQLELSTLAKGTAMMCQSVWKSDRMNCVFLFSVGVRNVSAGHDAAPLLLLLVIRSTLSIYIFCGH